MTERQATLTETQPTSYDVTEKDLPLHCPTSENSLWNSHPRVFLNIEDTGKAKCPYCGTEYHLLKS